MKRIYENVIKSHLSEEQQMVFLAGPRQVGKTTISRDIFPSNRTFYLNWDVKEPKLFFCDWSEINDEGQRLENFVACHLLKAIDFWNDYGLGNFDLYFIRDKDQQEVDFIITKEQMPWVLIEVKKSANHSVSKNLYRFHEQTKAPHAFQVVMDLPFENIDCFSFQKPVIVPLMTFLSQLV